MCYTFEEQLEHFSRALTSLVIIEASESPGGAYTDEVAMPLVDLMESKL